MAPRCVQGCQGMSGVYLGAGRECRYSGLEGVEVASGTFEGS